jgi:hypothetical protein
MSDDQVLRQLREQAAAAAAENSPLHVLDNAVLHLLVGAGWLIGRLWYGLAFTVVFASKGLVAYVLAVRHGYRKGVKKKVVPVAAPQPAQPQELLADNHIRDAYATPFGVPHGPNVTSFAQPG